MRLSVVMSNSTPQVKVTLSCFVQSQLLFFFPVDQRIEFSALIPFLREKLLSFPHYLHLFVCQSSEWLKGIVKNFLKLLVPRLGIRSFFPTQAVRPFGWNGINDLCVNARLIRIAGSSSVFTFVDLLAQGAIGKKHQDEWKFGDSHAPSLLTRCPASSAMAHSNAPQWQAVAAFLVAQTQSTRPAHGKRSAGAGRGRLAARFLAGARALIAGLPLGNHGERLSSAFATGTL